MTPIPILMYHSISSQATPRFATWTLGADQFADHLGYLDRAGYTPLTIHQLALGLQQPEVLPPRPVALTFDDGYLDFATAAFPLLDGAGFNATVFVSTGYIGGSAEWLVAERETTRPMLSWKAILELDRRGIEIGSHSHLHRRLDELPQRDAWEDIVTSKRLLEEGLGHPVRSFAYPHGSTSRSVQRLVSRGGFTSACAVKHAVSSTGDNPLALARVTITRDTDVPTLQHFLEGGLRTAPFPERLRTKGWRFARRARWRMRHTRRSAEA